MEMARRSDLAARGQEHVVLQEGPLKGLQGNGGRSWYLPPPGNPGLAEFQLLWSLESYLILIALGGKKYLSSEKHWETSYLESSGLFY